MSQTKGFSIVEVIMVVVIVSLVAGGGYLLWQNNQLKSDNKTQTSATPTPTTTASKSTPTPTADPYTGWKTYTDSKYGFSFKYPAAAKVSHQYGATVDDYSYVSVEDGSTNISFEVHPPLGCTTATDGPVGKPAVTVKLGTIQKDIEPKCFGYYATATSKDGTSFLFSINPDNTTEESKLILASVSGLTLKN